MRRQRFRLGSVLRHYELQKQKTDFELQQAIQTLLQTDAQIAAIKDEIGQVAAILHASPAAILTADGWLACYRKVAQLDSLLKATQERRQREDDTVRARREARTKWAIKEETLHSFEQMIAEFNHDQAGKAQQEMVDESVLRKWLGYDLDINPES